MKIAFGCSLDQAGRGEAESASIYLVAVLKLAAAGVNFAALTVERVRTKGPGEG